MIFLNAPLDLQRTPAYEAALALLQERHGHERVSADRDLFDNLKSYNETWRRVYDPETAVGLYVLAREDGTIGRGVYKQWHRLSDKHGVPATLLLADGEGISEFGNFAVTVIEESERSDQVFAVVSPEVVGPEVSSGPAHSGSPRRPPRRRERISR